MKATPIVIEPAAEQDIYQAIDFYEQKSRGAAKHFRDDLVAVIETILFFPRAAAIAFGNIRLKPMRRFPYVIGYVLLEEVVHVIGVQHGGLGWDAFKMP